MASIESLPPEILGRIISFAAVHEDTTGVEARRNRRAMALVAKRWTWFAQKELWREVVLLSPLQASIFAASETSGKHPTRTLSIDSGTGGWGARTAVDEALGKCAQLERLTLKGTISMASLGQPSLAGLKSLSLDGVIESSRLPHSLPFQLTNLSVWVDIKYPLAAMDLLVASSRRTLTSLVLYDGQDPESFDWEEEIHALLGPLRPVAGHLRHFELTAPADSATTTNALAAFLKGARRLEYLVFLTSDFTKAFTAIDVLSATLKRLSLVVLNLDPKGFEALRRKISNFPRLEVLGMVGRWWHGEEVSCAAKVLLAEECAKRGIRLLLDLPSS